MPLIQTSLLADLVKNIEQTVERWRKMVLRRLSIAGEKALNEARNPQNQHHFTDRTGNLRSSIGYLIVEDGKVVKRSSLPPVMDGKEGDMEWKAYAESLVSRFPTGMTLIMVAGMKYAAYVAARGFNVLDSAEGIASQLISELH